MAFSKAKLYDIHLWQTAAFFKAFSHPARLKIIQVLRKKRESSVEDLLKDHPLSDASLSEHLRILRNAHLVKYREQFPYTIYSIDEKNLQASLALMNNYFTGIRRKKQANKEMVISGME